MANVPTTSWDETSPANDSNASLGDDRIREVKTQLREVISVDHDFPSSGQAADNGQHKKVTLQEQADLGTGTVGATILGSQTVSGKGELVYTDEDDTDVQLTKSGKLNVPISTFTEKTTTVAADTLLINDSADTNAEKKILVSTLLKLIYPVGSIYSNASDGTNPATLFGFGTWALIGAGRIPICINSADADFDTLEETQGAKTHEIAEAELPTSLTVSVAARTSDQGGVGSAALMGVETAATSAIASVALTNVGSGTAMSIVPPVVVCAIWKRTA